MSKYVFKLYVVGQTPPSIRATLLLRELCESELQGEYELQIIDVLERPDLAEQEKILATPTLIKELPLPNRRIVGDLSDKDLVLLILGIHPPKSL